MPDERRCVVVGAGLLGLGAARALARRRWRVTVIEAGASVGHGRAGSTGDARIFRLGYPDPLYVDMALRSAELWRRLEAETGRALLHACGQLTFGDEAALDAIAGALAAAGAPVERLAPGEAARRFPGIDPAGPVLHEPASGVLAADECLRALCDGAGFELRTGVRVTGLHPQGGEVRVVARGAQDQLADVVVTCAGPASLALLDTETKAAAPASLPQVAYFAPAPGRPAGALPVFIEWGPDMLYGLPVPGNGPHAGTFKVSHHTTGPTLEGYDPAGAGPPGADDATLLAMLSGAVRRLLPGLDPVPAATERCVYDNTVDTDFVLDRVGGIVVGCGTSGHGFKFGPLLGELLADLAEGRPTPIGLERFALRRAARGATGLP